MRLIYKKIEEGADVNFVFGTAYGCPEGYTPLMSACNRGRLDAAKALLRSGADPNFMNAGGDLTLFWAIDGGPELIKLLVDYGVDLDARTPKDWTALSYARAMGKYGLTTEKGIYPEDVLKYYGATEYGSGPEALGIRSPREKFRSVRRELQSRSRKLPEGTGTPVIARAKRHIATKVFSTSCYLVPVSVEMPVSHLTIIPGPTSLLSSPSRISRSRKTRRETSLSSILEDLRCPRRRLAKDQMRHPRRCIRRD